MEGPYARSEYLYDQLRPGSQLSQVQLGLMVEVLGGSIPGASYYTKDNLIRILIERLA